MKLLLQNIPEPLRGPGTGLTECLRAFGRVRSIDRIVLFGSYARGEQHAASDVDLCIVADGAENQLGAAREFRRAIRDVRPKPAFSLLPITPGRLEEKKKAGDYFYKTILEEGVCVAEKDQRE